MFPVNLQLGNEAPSPLGYRDANLMSTINEQLNADTQYQSPVEKQKTEKLNQLGEIYDRVSGKAAGSARTTELKDEAIVPGSENRPSKFWESMDAAFASGVDQLGVIGASIPAAVIDMAGQRNPMEDSGFGILGQWLKDLKSKPDSEGESKASQFLNRMISAPFDFQDKLNKATSSTMDAEELGKIAEETTGLPEEYNPLSPNNIVVQKFAERAKINDELAHRNYKGGIGQAIADGNYALAGQLTALGVTQSMPIMLGLIGARGAGMSSLSTLGLLDLGVTGQTYRDLKAQNPDIDKKLLYTNAVLTGASEAGSELLGTNMIYDQAQRLFRKGAVDEAQQVLRTGLRGYVDNAFKKAFVGAAAFDEGSTEAINQIVKNAVDKWSGVRPDVDYTDGALDAFIIGVGAGTTVSMPYHIASKVSSAVNKTQVKNLTAENDVIAPYLENPDIPEQTKVKMLEQVAVNNEAINNTLTQDVIETANLVNTREYADINRLNSEIDQKESILQDPDMPAPMKEAAKNSITEMTNQVDQILKDAQERKGRIETVDKNAEVAGNPDKLSKVVSDIIAIGPEVTMEPNYPAIVEKVTQQLENIKKEKPVEGAEPDLTREALIADLEEKIAVLNASLPVAEEVTQVTPVEEVIPAVEEVIPVVEPVAIVAESETVIPEEVAVPVAEEVIPEIVAENTPRITREVLNEEEATALENELVNEGITINDIVEYENGQIEPEAGIVPEAVQQPGDDLGGNAAENIVGETEQTAEPTGGIITEGPVRTIAEVEADQRELLTAYHNALKAEGLYELAAEQKAPQEDLDRIKEQVFAEFGKTPADLLAEKAAIESAPAEPVVEEIVTEEKPKTAPEERSLADKIRSLKSKKGRTYDALLGVPVAIYDGALETIATAIEAGTSIAEAIKKAVAYIQKNSNVKDPVIIEEELVKTFEDAGILLKGLMAENTVPEVVEEIEQTPEEITEESINDFKKRLDKVLKSAKTQSLIKSGVAKADLAVKALKAVTDIVDHKTMLAAARAVKKLFTNITDNAYRSQIAQAKASLKTRLKGSKLGRTDLMKKFLNIDEKKMNTNELEEYNNLVRLLNDQYNSRLDSVIADDVLQKFIDKMDAKKVAEILKEQEVEVAQEEAIEDEPKESGRRKQLNAVTALNRKALRQGGYDPSYKPVAQALLNIDTETLSNRQMVDLNIALINLAVNDRLVGHEYVFKEYVGQQGLDALSARVGNSIKGLLESTLGAAARSLDVNTKIIFKGIKDATIFQDMTGVSAISNGNSQVANVDMKKGLEASYKNFLAPLKFPEFNNVENRFLRGLYSGVTQFNSIESQAKDFTRYKSLMEQSAEKLMKSTLPAEQREGQLRMDQYNEYLEPFETREAFEENFKATQPKNAKIVDFFREQFQDKLPELKLNSQMYAGKNIKEVNNYLPMSWKVYSGTDTRLPAELNDIIDPIYTFDPETGDVSEKQSSTTIERTNKNKIKDSDRILNLDFDRTMFDKYREMNYDIRTLKNRHLYNAIKGQEGFDDVVGGKDNSNVLTNGVRNMVQRQMGNTYSKTDIAPLINASRILSGKGVRQALFGVLQAAKQYPSVALRTAINLNTDIDLLFKGMGVGLNNPIFDNFGIGLRRSTRGGTNYELELNNIRKSDFSSSLGKLINAAQRVSKLTSEKLAYSLSASDDAVAKHSWAAYYMKYIRDNGGDVSKINWETEHLNPSQQAGAYADLMVSTTQNINDNSKQASLFYDNNDAKTIVRDVIAPFSGFARNSQANMEADLRTFSEGTPAEKKAAAVGILATVSEQVAFNTIKIFLITSMINAGSKFMQGMFADEEPEEKVPRENRALTVVKNASSDILFGGLGQAASYLAVKGVNQLNKAVQGTEDDLFFQYNPAQYGDPDFGVAGIYGILPQSIYNAGQKLDYVDGELVDTYKSKGETKTATTQVKPKDQALVTALFIIDALAIAGLSDAEISRLNQTIFRDIKKRTAPVKKFTIEYENKKATQGTDKPKPVNF